MKTLGKCSVNSQKLEAKARGRKRGRPFPGVGAETKSPDEGLADRPRDPARQARCKFTCSFLGNTPTLPVPAGTSRGKGVGRCSLRSLGRVRGWPRVSGSEGDPHPEQAGRAPRRVPGDPHVPGVAQRGEAERVGGREPGRGTGAGRWPAFRERRLGSSALCPAGWLRRPGFAGLGAAPPGPPCLASCTSSGASSR